MKTTRRDFYKLAGGAAFGALFTPVPWRLITDAALWSENWPGVPRPTRGELRARYTNCGLCSAGCAVRARCVGEQPIALAGVGGGLCPFGLAGHHLPYHPDRLRQGKPQEASAAVADAIAKCAPEERIAVLDLRPGRTASWTHRRAMAALKNGMYLAPPQPGVAVNLTSARIVLSLGAPLLDGWGSPAKVFAARSRFRLIQAEAVESRTATVADEWLPLRPGTEAALAHAIAGAMPISEAASLTGLAEQKIAALIGQLRENGPALVVDPKMSGSVIAANLALDAWGKTLGPRAEAPVPAAWQKAAPVSVLADVPDRSIRVLLIDESAPGEYLPWPEIAPKLAADPVVVSFSPSRAGYAQHARHVLPVAVYPESLDDVPAAVDSPSPAFRITASLVPPPAGMVNPAEFVCAVAGIAAGDTLRERADAILAEGRGDLHTYADGKVAPIKELKPDVFIKALMEGGCWCGETPAPGPRPPAPAVPAPQPQPSLIVLTESAPALASPLMSKVYRESNLRLATGQAAMHPGCGIANGARAVLRTDYGATEVWVCLDANVPPGAVVIARPSDSCKAGSAAQVVRV